ncbi:MAG TPA: RdgB/HAM1 family non-canonical purine NTP pyrophosphatase [Acidimicrobiales bacterium]|nr:RdgB/HAM1 family non-canonical purine NTP pyrophosphatase [Acidimicrobiales bacterium]
MSDGGRRAGNGAGPPRMRFVMASANRDKASEIAAILEAELGQAVELLPRPEQIGEVEETGETLEDNARLKADALLRATGIAAMADDTGLEVEALGGAPGVYSSRYAGEHASYAENVAKLLAALAEVGATGPDQRRARFRTVAVARFAGGREVVAEGKVDGTIAPGRRGEGGFGYDPVFVPDGGDGRSFAEMSPAEKHACSHRGRAFRALAVGLRSAGP